MYPSHQFKGRDSFYPNYVENSRQEDHGCYCRSLLHQIDEQKYEHTRKECCQRAGLSKCWVLPPIVHEVARESSELSLEPWQSFLPLMPRCCVVAKPILRAALAFVIRHHDCAATQPSTAFTARACITIIKVVQHGAAE
jgi:hypothetical protein